MDNVCRGLCVTVLCNSLFWEDLAIAQSCYSVQGARGGRILQRTEADEVLYFFMERLMQVGVAREEVKICSCLQMLLHSEFIHIVNVLFFK